MAGAVRQYRESMSQVCTMCACVYIVFEHLYGFTGLIPRLHGLILRLLPCILVHVQ